MTGGGQNRATLSEKAGAMGGSWGEGGSTFSVDDPALGEIIGGDLDGHPISWHDPDEILAHLSGDVGKNAVTALEFHHELGIRKGLHDATLGPDRFLFGHEQLLCRPSPGAVRCLGWGSRPGWVVALIRGLLRDEAIASHRRRLAFRFGSACSELASLQDNRPELPPPAGNPRDSTAPGNHLPEVSRSSSQDF